MTSFTFMYARRSPTNTTASKLHSFRAVLRQQYHATTRNKRINDATAGLTTRPLRVSERHEQQNNRCQNRHLATSSKNSNTKYHKSSNNTSGTFRDRITLDVRGGAGGYGIVSFGREPHVPIAPPDGGSGGPGGSVWLEATSRRTSLSFSTTAVRAPSGKRGGSGRRRGAAGSDVTLYVPCGTIVREVVEPDSDLDFFKLKSYDEESLTKLLERVEKRFEGVDCSDGTSDENDQGKEEFFGEEDEQGHEQEEEGEQPEEKQDEREEREEKEERLLCELDHDGARALIARGGRGGRGNVVFRSSTTRTPLRADPGDPGETRRIALELKTIADVGLVGFPNAGKSTLLRAVSRARPKVANYPFTTVRPHIGVVVEPTSTNCGTLSHSSVSLESTLDQSSDNNSVDSSVKYGSSRYSFGSTITVADIPGIVEGAHMDRGLGHEFLRHIERTTLLAYVIDVGDAFEEGAMKGAQRVMAELDTLRLELDLHQEGLSDRPACIVANKMDLGTDVAAENVAALLDTVGDDMPVFPVSAMHGLGISPLVHYLFRTVKHLDPPTTAVSVTKMGGVDEVHTTELVADDAVDVVDSHTQNHH